MPKHSRPLPARVGRYTYWNYEFAHPEETKGSAVPSASRGAHWTIRKTFRQIRDEVDTPRAQWHRRRAATHLKHIGIENPTPALLALAYYLITDRLWTQDSEAGTLLAQQLSEIQDALRTSSRGMWNRRTPWSWDALLPAIARDQMLFQEICALGPTRAGLVGTRWRDVPPIWEKYGVSEAVAQRVYRAYHRKMSELLGHGVRVSKAVRDAFSARGIEGPRVRPTRPMAGLQGLPPDEQTSIILHWFAHALRNLARYRDGHAPIPWHPTACRRRCLRVQRDLKA
jgi:hypothetical protein